MRAVLRATWVIARRDFVTTVWSPSFLFFLIGPLFPLLFGALLGSATASGVGREDQLDIAVIGVDRPAQALRRAADHLRNRLGEDMLPPIRLVKPAGDPQAQAVYLLGTYNERVQAVLVGELDRPTLYAPKKLLDTLPAPIAMAIDTARRDLAVGRDIPPVTVSREVVARTSDQIFRDRLELARGGQIVLMLLVMLLSGMLVSNLVEEKSNKVIEVLAAAVPVDAIFAGKLLAMLAMALTAITVWMSAGVAAAYLFLPEGLHSITRPGVGWTLYLIIALVYFMMCYLLIGGLMLGIGSQAPTAREVQTLSMPLTMGQLLIFGFATAGIIRPHDWLARAAAVFPFSSPLAMLARAAEFDQLWPHLVGVLWQGAWLLVVIRVSARLFRRSVLASSDSGGLVHMLKVALGRTT